MRIFIYTLSTCISNCSLTYILFHVHTEYKQTFFSAFKKVFEVPKGSIKENESFLAKPLWLLGFLKLKNIFENINFCRQSNQILVSFVEAVQSHLQMN